MSNSIGARTCDSCGSIIDNGQPVLVLGKLVLDRQFQKVTYDGKPVRLTQQQFEVLELLVSRAGKLVPRIAFFISIFPEHCDNKQIDVVVCRLRSRFRDVDPAFDRIETSWGRGYAWLRPEQGKLAA